MYLSQTISNTLQFYWTIVRCEETFSRLPLAASAGYVILACSLWWLNSLSFVVESRYGLKSRASLGIEHECCREAEGEVVDDYAEDDNTQKAALFHFIVYFNYITVFVT